MKRKDFPNRKKARKQRALDRLVAQLAALHQAPEDSKDKRQYIKDQILILQEKIKLY